MAFKEFTCDDEPLGSFTLKLQIKIVFPSEKNGFTGPDIDLFVPHQANIRIIEAAQRRVGLEDSLYLGKGQLAPSNAAQVTKIRRILEDLSLEIATPDEAREMLALKGGDQVDF